MTFFLRTIPLLLPGFAHLHPVTSVVDAVFFTLVRSCVLLRRLYLSRGALRTIGNLKGHIDGETVSRARTLQVIVFLAYATQIHLREIVIIGVCLS